MNPVLRNIIAIVVGAVVGGVVNMGLITISGSIIPPPEGVDPSDMESIKAHIELFKPKHFIMPFLAHALGTFVGALVATAIAGSRKMTVAMIVGVFYLIGGVASAFMIPAPTWFIALDLILAYLPMAWLAGRRFS